MRFMFTFLLGWVLATNSAFADRPEAARDELLVTPADGIDQKDLEALYGTRGGKLKRVIGRLNVHQISVPERAIDAVEQALAKNPKIKLVERNPLGKLVAVPNDPSFSKQWHLTKISAPGAWDTTFGSAAPIAILDTAFDNSNADIAGKYVSGHNATGDSLGMIGNSSCGSWAHGIWVASTAAGAVNNGYAGAGVAGANPIMPVRVFNAACGLDLATAAAGIIWAADHGAKVINMSFIFYWSPAPSVLINAVNYALNKNVVVVTAAGNDNQQYATDANGYVYYSYPQTIPNVVTVTATDSNDVRTSFSNFGPYIAVSAPGQGVISSGPNGSMGSLWGTSFSSPITAGVAGLVRAANPALTNLQVNEVIKSSADDLGAAGWDQYYGHGRVNAAAAVFLALATNPDPVDTIAPEALITSPSAGATVSGTIGIDVTATDSVGVSRVELLVNGEVVATDSSTPFRISLNTLNYPDGEIRLAARASDAAGNIGVSGEVRVTVKNTADPVSPMSLSSITPNQMKAGQTINVTIAGSGFKSGVAVSLSGNKGGAPSASVVSVSSGTIVVKITAKANRKGGGSAKVWSVTVKNPDGGVATLPSSFTVNP